VNMFSIYNHKINFFYCLDTGLYICSNCDSYIPSTNRVDWLEHTQAFHETAQVKNYGPVPAGKHRKSLERGSSIPTGNFSDFFR